MEVTEEGRKRPIEVGAWGQRAAANVAYLRERAGMTQAMLAERVQRLGRSMAGGVVGKIEQCARRIDVDDLAAFALALGVTPSRLMLTAEARDDRVVETARDRYETELDAWQWALGEKPLDGYATGGIGTNFAAENRPSHVPESLLASKVFEHPDLVRSITRTAGRARRLGVGLAELHLATAYAYLTQGNN